MDIEGERKMVSEESVVGSYELKNFEGEEVFQEAIDPLSHFHDPRGDDAASTVSELPSTLADEIPPDNVEELDNFQEAIGVADQCVKNLKEVEVIATQEVPEDQQGQLNSSCLDGVGTEETEGGLSCNESHSIRDHCLESSSSDFIGGKEIADLNTDGKMVFQEASDLVNGNSGLSSHKSENEDLEYVTPKQNGSVLLENGSTDKVDYTVAKLHTESKSDEEMINQGSDDGYLKEDGLDPDLRDDKLEEQCNASVQDDTCEKACGHSAHGDLEPPHEIFIEMDDETNGTDIICEFRNDKEMGISDSQRTECKHFGNNETNDDDVGSNSEHLETVGETGEFSTAVDDRKVNGTAGRLSLPENSFATEMPAVQATATNLEEGRMNAYRSKISNEENQGNYENSSIVREPEKKLVNNAKEKLTPQITEEQNSESVSSSGKSVATSTPLVRPAGLGSAAPLLKPAPRAVQQQSRVNYTVSNTQSQKMEDTLTGESEEYDETREKLQMIRVKFLRLASRFGQTPHNVVVAQVLYRLGLAEQLRGRNGGRVGAFSFDRASAMAEQLESAGQEPLDFSCTIMVLGKTGVGKSATINSIFDEVKFNTNAFNMGTKKVQDVVGTVQGIKVRVIDTPGLLPSWSDQRHNEKTLHSVKRFIKKSPPDIVLYLDRLDTQSRDFSDMPLLRTITDIFGPSIWFNAIVGLTHAASAPPDGPNGTPSSYDMFVTQRSHVVQQAIRQAAGDMRLMNPISLVENHSACRIDTSGQRVLPNGQVWKPHLLLLSFASKILAEANALLKLQDSPPEKHYTARTRAPPLPYLLSTLLQSRPQLKLPEEQFSDEDSYDTLDEPSDSGDETDPDDLPPFKPLTKAQIRNLSRAQKKAYLDEVDYREKLFMKKQLKDEKKQRKMMKKMAESLKDLPSDYSENMEEESGGAAAVPVPMPDMSLPASFDSDTPTHRYRFLDSSNQWLVRPVLETHGWDHDVGYEGLNVERLFVLKNKIPLSFSGQVTKDKKDANVQMEMASSVKYGEGKATSLGFDMQTVGKDLAYTLRNETKFCNFRRNKATAGLTFTLLGDALSAGVKVEDKFIANKQFELVIAGGAMAGHDDVAYGGSLEAQLRDKNYPLGRSLSTLGLSVMDWHGDLAVGCNLQSQIPIGRLDNDDAVRLCDLQFLHSNRYFFKIIA
ncbi:translocase of chloroplast 90, chloroplastic [Trifolium repens]|nr:translocase of chloroplast 90, chloroplastic [Trifolium repens]